MTIAIAVAICNPSAHAAEQKIALVIGNAGYPTSKLRNPVNDAKAMADKLKALGFDVTLRTDAGQRDMTRAISQFGQKIALGSVSLFYYAGHGMQVRGKNYLIPIDAEIENESSVVSEAVDVDQVLNQIGPARLSMVILDACRNNPFERKFRSSAGGGLAQIDAPTGTLLAYATAPGKVAADGNGSNGLYTEALLKALDTPGLKVEDIFKQVRINVLKESDNLQIPWESSSLTGEFYFRAPIAAKPAVNDERLRAAEQQSAQLQKTLEEERKKRDSEAEAIKREMEKLRSELLAMRAPPPPAPAPAPAPTVVAAAPPPATPAAPKPAPAPVATPSPPIPAAPAAAPPAQVALAAPAAQAPAPASAGGSAQWAERIALIENFKGALTLSKAFAILFDVSSPEDLTALVTLEQHISRQRYHSAFAIGANTSGRVQWGGAWQWRLPAFAADSAMELCQRAKTDRCKVVLANGEFSAKEFIAFARLLGAGAFDDTRNQFFAGIRKLPAPVTLMSGGPLGPPTFGYSSPVSANDTAPAAAAPVADPTLYSTEWAPRRAALEKSGTATTYAKAVAVLLDINSPADVALLTAHEESLKSLRWQSAGAFGVDAQGHLTWAGSYQWNRLAYAEETAMQNCARTPGDACKVVFVNGEFRSAAFIEAMKGLGAAPVAAVRDAFLRTLSKVPPPSVASNDGLQRGIPSYVLLPRRD